ncbi:lycopene cyclase domain-containing protein [Humibacter ginsenosidimutans]|uniref:Lycopene cyclase domain-containing protein n=1 Tax=Humibacter ginsenosidimutans TaxID=2599293 RepID=A0A5B8M4G1_9MICO|nr:lycopene cyclase domain-containing protein [Humibacter ginsenosidimutans]QDZ15628.1 lycopene cyclase domain-containing protein [Humibacter ginsenosidimutans]
MRGTVVPGLAGLVLSGSGSARSEAYPILALIFLAAAAAVAVMAVELSPRKRRDTFRRWSVPAVVSSVVVVLLTAVFDSLLIAGDVIRYDDRLLSGIRVGSAPIEDFAYPLAAILLVPSLWSLVGTIGRPRRPIDDGRASGASSGGEPALERVASPGESERRL